MDIEPMTTAIHDTITSRHAALRGTIASIIAGTVAEPAIAAGSAVPV
jgi:hypothetical protein